MSEELSTQVPFYSTQGDLSDNVDQEEVSSKSFNPTTFPIINVSSLADGFSYPSVALSCPTALFRSTTMTTPAHTSSKTTLVDGCNVRVAAQPKSTCVTDGTNCSVLSYIRGDQLSDIPSQSTVGKISYIDEPKSSSPISSSASFTKQQRYDSYLRFKKTYSCFIEANGNTLDVIETAFKKIPWEEDEIPKIITSTEFSFDPFEADCLLERLDPLDYYRRFCTFTSISFLTTKKESSLRNQVLVATADLRATFETVIYSWRATLYSPHSRRHQHSGSC
jgi:hypothetical protein